MRRIAAAALVLLLALLPSGIAKAEIPDEEELSLEIERQMEQYDLEDWEEYISALPDEIKALWNGGGTAELMDGFLSGEGAEGEGILDKVFSLIKGRLRQSVAPLSAILGIALLSGLAGVLLEGDGIKEVVDFLCMGMFAAVTAGILQRLFSVAGEAVERLSGFTKAAAPVLATMIAACGNTASGGLVQPLTVFMSDTVSGIFSSAVLPIITLSAVVATAGELSGGRRLDRLFSVVKSALKWLTGIVFTIFLGLISIEGISAAGVDSLSIRTLKYTLDKGIPMVGSAVSGTLDTARGCAVLIKNAAGLTAMLVGIGLILAPVVEIACTSFALKIASAMIELVTDGRMASLAGKVSEVCGLLAAAVIVMGLMFVIMLGLFIATGRIGV